MKTDTIRECFEDGITNPAAIVSILYMRGEEGSFTELHKEVIYWLQVLRSEAGKSKQQQPEAQQEKMPDRASEDYNEKMIELLESKLESLRKENEKLVEHSKSIEESNYNLNFKLANSESELEEKQQQLNAALRNTTRLLDKIVELEKENEQHQNMLMHQKNELFKKQKDCQHEQHYPNTVRFSFKDPDFVIHLRTNRCAIEHPHHISECCEFVKTFVDGYEFRKSEEQQNQPQPEQAEVKCPQCEGRGNLSKSQNEYIECDWCHGSGVIVCEQQPEAQHKCFDPKECIQYGCQKPQPQNHPEAQQQEEKWECYEIWRPNIPANGCKTQCNECAKKQAERNRK